MSEALRRHIARQTGASLLVVREDAAAGLPAAAARAAASFYPTADTPTAPIRVCRGTSCHLAGAIELQQGLDTRDELYCLGYCDRAPAIMRSDGRVIAPCRERDPSLIEKRPPASPDASSIRCAAPRPIVTERVGRGDHAELVRAQQAGAGEGLRRALAMRPDEVVLMLERSGERGRGGAGFSTGLKWRRGAESVADVKYVIANGDEGDPGAFIDRILMERDPHAVLEGLAICGYAVGAEEGIVFIRSEYPVAITRMEHAIADAAAAGLLGPSILGSGFTFNVTVFPGRGSFVCGEETAMLNAIEGLRGEVRFRPPYPTEHGLYDRPTVVNNVETLVSVPWIMRHGADAYADLGTTASSGTKAMCLNHGFMRPGIVEVELGLPLRELIEDLAGGGANGTALEAVLLGGPMGSVLAPADWDVPICYEAMRERGIQLGHGGLVAVPEGSDLRALFLHLLRFMQDESCGKCVPCRLGSRRALELAEADGTPETPAAVGRLLDVMAEGSLCAFGQEIPRALEELLARFGERIFTAGER